MKSAIFVLVMIASVAVSGQDSSRQSSNDSVAVASQKDATSSEVAPGISKSALTATTSSAAGPDYIIGIEDVLGINVWHEAEMSKSVPVRPDGKISLPLLGEFEASGRTPKQLQAAIEKQLGTLMNNPEVTVIVEKINSIKFNIMGEVGKPGSYPLSKPMTVLDAVAVAGGL